MKKEELENLIKIKGKVRGVVFQTDVKYVLSRWGKEGLKRLEKKMEEWKIDLPFKGAEAMEWYPIGKRVVSLLLIKETFGLENKDIREMGSLAPKFSIVVKLLFKLFTPLKRFAKEIPRYWKEHYTVGELEVEKVSEKAREMLLNLKGIKLDPLFCLYLEGYFERVIKFIYPQTKVKEIKCQFKGDEFCQYLFQW